MHFRLLTPQFYLLILAAILGFNSVGIASHPYHVSYAEIELNQATGNFEVAICLWPADLEKALSKQSGKPIDLDKVDNLDSMMKTLIERDFKLCPVHEVAETGTRRLDAPLKMNWVGHEKNLKKVWVYFELFGQQQTDSWTLENRIFVDLNEDQSNFVELTVGEQETSLTFVSGKLRQSLSTKRAKRAQR